MAGYFVQNRGEGGETGGGDTEGGFDDGPKTRVSVGPYLIMVGVLLVALCREYEIQWESRALVRGKECGGVLTGDVSGINFRQSLQADDGSDTYTADSLAVSLVNCFLDALSVQ